ncbi:MAG: ImmA/IrrE family metallo-endopeptidase [Flavisolibacter sp.]
MAGSISFRLSPSVLEWARVSMGYTPEEAAKKAGTSTEHYLEWERGEKQPTYRQLETLAEKVYKRSLALLLLKSPPIEDPIQQDFRNLSNAEIRELAPEVRLALRRAKRYQLILDEVSAPDEVLLFKSFKVRKSESPAAAASRFREHLHFSIEIQKSWKPDEAFRKFRQLIENAGIAVFQLKMPVEQARAFCLSGERPLVVLNSNDSKNAQIFSLFHEVCHILFNTNDIFRDQASGNLAADYREVEFFCNDFAASFLVPESDFDYELIKAGITKNMVSDSQIQQLGRTYNVSNEVITRKLLIRGLVDESFLWQRKKLWDANAKAAKEKERENTKENENGRDQGIRIVYEKGEAYVSKVVDAYYQGRISSADLSGYLEAKLKHLPKIIERLRK